LMELALKMNFLSYNFHPWKREHELIVSATFRSFQFSLLKPLGLRQKHDATMMFFHFAIQ
jgi:hypothetical protein